MKPSVAKNKCLWKQHAHGDEQKKAVMSLKTCAYPLLPFLFLSPLSFSDPPWFQVHTILEWTIWINNWSRRKGFGRQCRNADVGVNWASGHAGSSREYDQRHLLGREGNTNWTGRKSLGTGDVGHDHYFCCLWCINRICVGHRVK